MATLTKHLMKMDTDNKPHFLTESFYMPVARKLKPWQYEKAWLAYSHKHFTSRFIADEMILLKRMVGERNWVVSNRFKFENLPVATKQGELF